MRISESEVVCVRWDFDLRTETMTFDKKCKPCGHKTTSLRTYTP